MLLMGEGKATIWFKVSIGIAVFIGMLKAFVIVIDSWKRKK